VWGEGEKRRRRMKFEVQDMAVSMGCDVNENELILMETIHFFFELLDQYFSNVCELDIVFQFNKVYAILDEFILAGEVQETSKRVILERMKDLEKLE
jgi:AP-2 complex subunit sigma-1